jgi:hypothetical protein
VRAFLLHLSKILCHVFELIPNIKAYVDRGALRHSHRDTIAGSRIDLDDLLLLRFVLRTEDKSRKIGATMMQNLVDPSAGWGYALQCSPTVRAGGKVFGGLPILPDKTAEYKATYSRRRLTENRLYSVDLESRFYAVLSKAAQVA